MFNPLLQQCHLGSSYQDHNIGKPTTCFLYFLKTYLNESLIREDSDEHAQSQSDQSLPFSYLQSVKSVNSDFLSNVEHHWAYFKQVSRWLKC